MSAFAIAPDGDLALVYDDNARSNLSIIADPVVAGAIQLRNRLLLFLGEWFLDTRIGVPYYQFVFVKNPDRAALRALFRRVILSVPIITSVSRLDLEYDPSTRKLSLDFAALAADGRKIEGGSGVPFVVDGKDISAPSATNNGANT